MSDEWKLYEGDCIPLMYSMPEESVDMAVFSPPFPSVFAYTQEQADMGNSEEVDHDAPLHFTFFFRSLLRVMKPGRVAIVHCTQIANSARSGKVGLTDFRGMLIRMAQRTGWTYEYDWLIRVNPQASAIRTRSRELQFAGLETDRAKSRGVLGMYLIKLRKPGENAVKVCGPEEVTRNDWIAWAEDCWSDIVETDTLNVAEGRGKEDTKHITPLQLGIYERCIRLFSDPGELVLDPFAGIGSCGYVCLGGASPKTKRYLNNPRRFVGCELKPEYAAAARRNMARALKSREVRQKTLF